MAIIIEDGTIVASANSYASVSDADTYHEDMGNTAWADYSDELKEAALIRGTLMIESRYRGRWVGYKTNNNSPTVQLLAWPRRAEKGEDPTTITTLTPLEDPDGIDIGINSIPPQVQQACYEAAYMQASGNSLVPNVVSRDKYVTKTKVDVIEQEFSDNTPAVDRFPLIDQLLQELANAGGVNLTMVVGVTQAELDSIKNKDAIDDWVTSLGGA